MRTTAAVGSRRTGARAARRLGGSARTRRRSSSATSTSSSARRDASRMWQGPERSLPCVDARSGRARGIGRLKPCAGITAEPTGRRAARTGRVLRMTLAGIHQATRCVSGNRRYVRKRDLRTGMHTYADLSTDDEFWASARSQPTPRHAAGRRLPQPSPTSQPVARCPAPSPSARTRRGPSLPEAASPVQAPCTLLPGPLLIIVL